MIGKTISHYKIIEKIGEGGMGIVYKAEDSKLQRNVALKFLPPELTRDAEAKERFIHEARAASALQHNNICTIHAVDETEDGQLFIYMDHYKGEILKKKIEKRPLKLDDAINIAVQIAQGLAKAHEAGIVHRDIKPGSILGTTWYMSPEQLRGEKVDHRTDIWALGIVLYEMITGQLPFKGEYEQAVSYAILHDEPEPINSLKTGVPMALEGIVAKAMAKNPKDRYQHVDEVPVDLKQIEQMSPSIISNRSSITLHEESAQRSNMWRQVLPWGLVVLQIILFVWWFWSSPTASKLVTRFVIELPMTQKLSQAMGNTVAISSDGTGLAYVSQGDKGTKLYIRKFAEFEAKQIPGTEGALSPFFSHDGKWVGFIADGELKKVSLLGGAPQSLCEAQPSGGSWGKDNTIIFSNAGLWRINAAGGQPEKLTTTFKMGATQELKRKVATED